MDSNQFLNVPKDVFVRLLQDLSYEEILNVCQSHPQVNNKCQSYEEVIFRDLLQRDYGIAGALVPAGTARQRYLDRRREQTFMDIFDWLHANNAGITADLLNDEIIAHPMGLINNKFMGQWIVNNNFIVAVPLTAVKCVL